MRTGEPLSISAEAWNGAIDLVLAHRTGVRAGVVQPSQAAAQRSVIKVRNNSESSCGRFGVLGIDAPVITPDDNLNEFKGNLVLGCVVPTESHRNRFVVLLEPLGPGKFGFAVAAGAMVVRVDVVDESHEFADVEPGNSGSLRSGDSGAAHISWREGGLGEQWAVVEVGNPGRKTDDPKGPCISKLSGLMLSSLSELDGAETSEAWGHLVITAAGCLRKATPNECG